VPTLDAPPSARAANNKTHIRPWHVNCKNADRVPRRADFLHGGHLGCNGAKSKSPGAVFAVLQTTKTRCRRGGQRVLFEANQGGGGRLARGPASPVRIAGICKATGKQCHSAITRRFADTIPRYGGRGHCLASPVLTALARYTIDPAIVVLPKWGTGDDARDGYIIAWPHRISRRRTHAAGTEVQSGIAVWRKKANAPSSGFPNHFRYTSRNSSDLKNWLKARSTARRKSSSFLARGKAIGS
jgi:hypothetical protein